MALGADTSAVDYRDDELDVVTDGDDLGVVDLDDLCDVDDDWPNAGEWGVFQPGESGDW